MDESTPQAPYWTETPGIGGVLRSELADFRVEEIAAYEPSGQGDHLYLWVEKRGLTTPALVGALARALGVSERDIGYAGLKDKHAITRQFLSLPPPARADQVSQISLPNADILWARSHGNKLRTGHLRGNAFELTLRSLDCPASEAQSRALHTLERLARAPGAPNWFGPQRFGRGGDNARLGRALVRKTDLGDRPPRGRKRRLYVSAYQSELFNRYLTRRLERGCFDEVLAGDVLKKTDSGGLFVCQDPATDQARFEAGAICITGPMFGHRMKRPEQGTPAAALENELLEAEDLCLEDFAHLTKLALGTRRSLGALVEGPSAWAEGESVSVKFSLPAGSYATAIMRELMKGNTSFPE